MRVFQKHLILNVNLAQNHGTFKGNFPGASAALPEAAEKAGDGRGVCAKSAASGWQTVTGGERHEGGKKNADCSTREESKEVLIIIDNFRKRAYSNAAFFAINDPLTRADSS